MDNKMVKLPITCKVITAETWGKPQYVELQHLEQPADVNLIIQYKILLIILVKIWLNRKMKSYEIQIEKYYFKFYNIVGLFHISF